MLFGSPLRYWWLAAAAILLIEGGVHLWLKPEQSQWDSVAVLELNIPDLAIISESGSVNLPDGGGSSHGVETQFRFHNQPERLESANQQLSFAGGTCGVFLPNDNPTLSTPALELFYFEYDAGNPRFIHDVFGHAPEVCMKAIGAELRANHPSRIISVGDSSIPVRVIEFETPSLPSPLWVFKLTWVPEEAPYQPDDSASSLRREKILAGVLGNPRPPARVILVGARNFDSVDAAWRAYQAIVVDHLSLKQQNEYPKST